MQNSERQSVDPKLSIITVNLNHRDGLARTLSSVHEQQSFDSFEHIVVDGGSTDGSGEVIQSYASRLAHWISEPDRGIYHAMNKGIAWAQGEYLLFLNSGDWLVDNVLKAVFADFPEADIVYGNLYFCENGQVAGPWVPPEAERLSLHFFAMGSLPHPASFIRRSLLAGSGFSEDFRIVADRKFFLDSFLRSDVRFAHLDRFISYFPKEGMSHAPQNDILHQDEVTKLLSLYFKPQVLPFIQNRRMFTSLLRGRSDMLLGSPKTADCLCRWNDLFFWLYRWRATRAGLHAFSWLVFQLEKRKRRAAAQAAGRSDQDKALP